MSKIISYHNFMFPFRFDKITKKNIEDRHEFYKDETFDKRVVINEGFKNSLFDDGWVYEKFEVENALDYNELVYFHDFVKDTLFNTKDFDENDKASSYFFSKKVADEDEFILNIKEETKIKKYALNLISLSLRVFDTGVAILSIELENYKYKSIDDILKINDFGRRIYPQFLDKDNFAEQTKKSFLPDKVKIKLGEKSFCEDFKYETFPSEVKIASYIMEFLGSTFTGDINQYKKYYIQPSVDDRMFVISWYGNNGIANSLKDYSYEKSDRWYEYVFVDGNGKTVQSPKMQEKLIKEATYDRWMNYGTLYGASRYSFVCLSSDYFPLPHMKTMYYQMFTLLLAQRASLLRFSDEITAISDLDSDESTTQKISILYKNYLRFVNKLYFKEITAQDQGIELYDKALDILNISRDIDDLTREIATLNSYAFMLQEKEEKEEMNKITKLATLFLPPTFVAGIFGMNIFPENFVDNIGGWFIAFGGMIGLTWWIVRVNSISIKEYFKGKK